MRGKKSGAEKQAARRFGEFVRSVRRNLRQAHRILQRADQEARRCYEKAGVAMLHARAASGMSEEEFAVWLAPFGLSQDRLFQCLELGQVTFDRAETLDRAGAIKGRDGEAGANEPRSDPSRGGGRDSAMRKS